MRLARVIFLIAVLVLNSGCVVIIKAERSGHQKQEKQDPKGSRSGVEDGDQKTGNDDDIAWRIYDRALHLSSLQTNQKEKEKGGQ